MKNKCGAKVGDIYKMCSQDLYGGGNQDYHVMLLTKKESASYLIEDTVCVCLVLETGNQREVYLYNLLHNAELVA